MNSDGKNKIRHWQCVLGRKNRQRHRVIQPSKQEKAAVVDGPLPRSHLGLTKAFGLFNRETVPTPCGVHRQTVGTGCAQATLKRRRFKLSCAPQLRVASGEYEFLSVDCFGQARCHRLSSQGVPLCLRLVLANESSSPSWSIPLLQLSLRRCRLFFSGGVTTSSTISISRRNFGRNTWSLPPPVTGPLSSVLGSYCS